MDRLAGGSEGRFENNPTSELRQVTKQTALNRPFERVGSTSAARVRLSEPTLIVLHTATKTPSRSTRGVQGWKHLPDGRKALCKNVGVRGKRFSPLVQIPHPRRPTHPPVSPTKPTKTSTNTKP
jgi:hypothetical protein